MNRLNRRWLAPWLPLPLTLAALLLALALPASAPSQTRDVSLQVVPYECTGSVPERIRCLEGKLAIQDRELVPLLGGEAHLRQWRGGRVGVCRRYAVKAERRPDHALYSLGCEQRMNQALLNQLRERWRR